MLSNSKPSVSLWKGPLEDGITFSLLSKFLECRERFRLKVVEGLIEDEGFSHALEYGNYWHEAEEAHSAGQDHAPALLAHRNKLLKRYPEAQAEINKWYHIARVAFPVYIKRWQKHPDEMGRKPILEEVAFRVPYTLPSGRKIVLRGKYDCVLSVKNISIYLQENKSKGTIDQEGIQGTVDQNLQTMLYQIALRESFGHIPSVWAGRHGDPGTPREPVSTDPYQFQYLDGRSPCNLPQHRKDSPPRIVGSIYNVVRRPLSDRYAIKQKKSESEMEFYARLGALIADKPEEYFMRWKILLHHADIEKFKQRVFHPILEQLVDWWESIEGDPFNPWTTDVFEDSVTSDRSMPNKLHFQAPWGVYNSLASGWRGSYFEYLTTGRTIGLRHASSLYPELDTP